MHRQFKFFCHDLTRWYGQNKRDLPWRRTKDPYKIWVSEVMLQQTTVKTVIAYYERWIRSFPTVQDLARAPLQKVLKEWQGLGYYNRAKNLHKTAAVLVNEHQGAMPQDRQVIRSLPGFGPYTSASVLSIAFDLPLAVIDANVRRVVMRLLALPGVADTKQDARINEFLDVVLPARGTGDFNQALMELGAMVCRPKAPDCLVCPITRYCQAYKKSQQDTIPRQKRKAIQSIQAVIALIRKDGDYFIQKRPSYGLLADLWEFPGGKIEEGETKTKALARELEEELGICLRSSRHLFDVKHYYTQFKVSLSVYICRIVGEPKTDDTHRWVGLKDLYKYPMPSGSAKIVKRLSV